MRTHSNYPCLEAGVFEEALLTLDVDLGHMPTTYAQRSLRQQYRLNQWWRDGLDHVTVHC